jgi:Leu/Phe-tRNA-protein transferase
MPLKVSLADVLTPELLERHYQHILDFLALEGITPHQQDLGATQLSDRQLKELLEELAEC